MNKQNLEQWTQRSDSAWPKWFVGTIIIAFASFIVVISLYFLNFHGEISTKQDVWGTFGDYVGGVLNPFFSFLAFVALLFTIVLQSHQLEISKQELIASRNELELTRKQTIMTGIATIVLNQVASYREEIAFLKFKGIGQKEELNLHQLLYSMNAHIDKSGAEHLGGKLDPTIFEERTVQYFSAVKSDLMSYQTLLEGLSRRC
ncbi:MAG: hypothetical protein ACU841_11250 [Gammaproteobacteria bacterium]